jgi:hypothetical protein
MDRRLLMGKIVIIILNILVMCAPVFAQPVVTLVLDPDVRTITIGEQAQEIAVIARTDKQNVQFAWSVKGPGTIAGDSTSPGILYLSPTQIEGQQTQATVTVKVTDDQGKTTTHQMTLTLVSAALPTPTPALTPTRTPTPKQNPTPTPTSTPAGKQKDEQRLDEILSGQTQQPTPTPTLTPTPTFTPTPTPKATGDQEKRLDELLKKK